MIIPKENKKDWDELDDYIKAGIEIHFAETYSDVYHNSFEFEPLTSPEANQPAVYPPRLPGASKVKSEKEKLEKKKKIAKKLILNRNKRADKPKKEEKKKKEEQKKTEEQKPQTEILPTEVKENTLDEEKDDEED